MRLSAVLPLVAKDTDAILEDTAIASAQRICSASDSHPDPDDLRDYFLSQAINRADLELRMQMWATRARRAFAFPPIP